MLKQKPFLKWAGNKFHCLDPIVSSLPKANRLIEPFTGSGAIFLNSSYQTYLLGEENYDLISLYQNLQYYKQTFIDYCKTFFIPGTNQESVYYKLREEFNASRYTQRRAALFLYLNRHGYNGLCRYNLKGKYNVPFGRYKKPYFPQQEMLYFVDKCQISEFVHGGFEKTFALAKPGDIIYCDPPYVPRDQKSHFTAYAGKRFTQEAQIHLAKLAQEGANKGITVLISNHDTPFIRKQYAGSDIKSFSVSRTINCKGNQRKKVREILAIFR